MRRPSLAVAVPTLLAVAILVTGCAGSGDGAATTTTRSGPVLTVCTDAPYEVFEYGDPAALEGFDVELVGQVAERLDRPVDFTLVPLDRFPTALAEGTCDLAASALTPPSTGGGDLVWSTPYLEVDQALVVRDDDAATLTGPATLAGRAVGVVDGSPGADLAAGVLPPDAVVTTFPTWSELDTALRRGTVDAALGDGPLADRAALVDGGVAVVERFPTDAAYALALAPSDTDLLAAVDGALAEMAADGSLDQLRERWFGR